MCVRGFGLQTSRRWSRNGRAGERAEERLLGCGRDVVVSGTQLVTYS